MASGVAIGVGTAAGVVAALVAAWHALTYYEVDVKCERPKYKVIQTLGPARKSWIGKIKYAAEVRRYAPMVIAEVSVNTEDGRMREALGSGFRQIAGFIFGKNTVVVPQSSDTTTELASTKVSMTAPVGAEMSAKEPGTYKISFVMPSNYTVETLPKPINPDVVIKEVPERVMASLGWSGRSPSEEVMLAKAADLRALLDTAGLAYNRDDVHLLQYHPPFAPWWLRWNEMQCEVQPSGGANTE